MSAVRGEGEESRQTQGRDISESQSPFLSPKAVNGFYNKEETLFHARLMKYTDSGCKTFTSAQRDIMFPGS